jgi:hypothetical protein
VSLTAAHQVKANEARGDAVGTKDAPAEQANTTDNAISDKHPSPNPLLGSRNSNRVFCRRPPLILNRTAPQDRIISADLPTKDSETRASLDLSAFAQP